ncbi:MAG: 2-oxoisovalerate dehydrogenase subunit beta [Candidatus Tectimicrobiota bacterium]|nr:MAG: 2-oxoisovalerate dehydrogenase subunit beta [Candidatus Tectomicrobia bacterium]
MEKRTLVEALNEALRLEMAADERVILLGEDIGKEGGVFRVTEGLQERFGAARVMDTPIAESGLVGMAIGMAIAGLRPVVEIQFMGFLYPALDQIINHLGRMRNRSRGRFTCPVVIRVPYGGGIRPPEHHSESTEAMLVHTPGIQVVVPATPYDAKGLLISAIRSPDPVIFLEPKRIYRAVRQEIPDEPYTVPLGKARLVQEGNDVTVIAWGSMLHEVLQAAEQLAAEGITLDILDLRTLSPMDVPAIVASVEKTGRAVVVHEAPRTCGLGAEIVAQINEKALLALEAPVERVTGFDTVFPLPQLEKYYLPNAERIAQAVRRVLAF